MVETRVDESRRDVCVCVCVHVFVCVCVCAKNPGIVEGGIRNIARGRR